MATILDFFYLGTVDDDQAHGTTVKKILEAAPGANSTTTMTWTTTTAAIRTHLPLAGSTAATDTSNQNGWAFNNGGADGLGSVASARRTIPSGVWQFNMSYTLNAPALLATIACTVTARVYRVASATAPIPFLKTLLFTATSANFSASGNVQWFSASQPEIVLEAGEVLLFGYTALSAATAALVLGAVTNTVLTVNLGSGCSFGTPSPGVRTRYSQAVVAVAKGVASTIRKTKKNIVAVMLGVASIIRKTKKIMSLSVMKGVASVSTRISYRRTITAVMLGRATIVRKVKHIITAVMKGVAFEIRKTIKILPLARMAGVATLSRRITAHRTMSARMAGVATLIRKNKKPITAVMLGRATIVRKTKKIVTAVMLGRATLVRKTKKIITARMAGVAVLNRLNRKLLSARMAGVATLTPKIRAARTLSARMVGRARGFVKIDFTILSRITGGGGTVVNKIIHYVFDD